MSFESLDITRIFSEDEDDDCASDASFVSDRATQFENSNSDKHRRRRGAGRARRGARRAGRRDRGRSRGRKRSVQWLSRRQAGQGCCHGATFNSNTKAPTFDEFTGLYYEEERAKKRSLFRRSGHKKFKTFCDEVRLRKKKVFLQKVSFTILSGTCSKVECAKA